MNFLKKLEGLILKNLQNEKLSIAWLAAQFLISERQFRRMVKEQTGKTPTVFIRDLRLATAKNLLEKGELSVKEVSLKTGYQKASWFSNQYFLKYHESPKTTKLQSRNKQNS